MTNVKNVQEGLTATPYATMHTMLLTLTMKDDADSRAEFGGYRCDLDDDDNAFLIRT